MENKKKSYDKEMVINEALLYLHTAKVDKTAEYFIRNLVHIITNPEKYE